MCRGMPRHGRLIDRGPPARRRAIRPFVMAYEGDPLLRSANIFSGARWPAEIAGDPASNVIVIQVKAILDISG